MYQVYDPNLSNRCMVWVRVAWGLRRLDCQGRVQCPDRATVGVWCSQTGDDVLTRNQTRKGVCVCVHLRSLEKGEELTFLGTCEDDGVCWYGFFGGEPPWPALDLCVLDQFFRLPGPMDFVCLYRLNWGLSLF